ncbi:DUF4190 domain-containing protein [Bacteroidota bacterium]
MKKNLIRLIAIFIISLVVTSCSNTKQVACPDNSDNRSVEIRSKQAYKTRDYKAANVSHRPHRKFRKINTAVHEPVLYQAYKSIQDIQIRSPYNTLITNDVKLIEALDKFKLSASTDTSLPASIQYSNHPILDESFQNEIVEFPDSSDITTNDREIDDIENKDLQEESTSDNRIPTEDKSVRKMAVAALVLSIAGFIFLPIVSGIIAVVLGGIAISRAKKTISRKGIGLAIAGLILGILNILLGIFYVLTLVYIITIIVGIFISIF